MNKRKQRSERRRIRNWGNSLSVGRTKDNKRQFVLKLKASPTAAELRVVEYLQQLNICHAFQKQRGPFVADFWFKHFKLILEVDGSSHNGREGYDAMRDAWCRSNGYRVVRIRNEQTFAIADFIAAVPELIDPIMRSTRPIYKTTQKRLLI